MFICNSVILSLVVNWLIFFFWLADVTGSSGEFQEVEGESEERRKARLERHQRTQERAVCVFFF